VVLDPDEYDGFKSHDTRQSYAPHELGDDLKVELAKGYQGKRNRRLDHLLD